MSVTSRRLAALLALFVLWAVPACRNKSKLDEGFATTTPTVREFDVSVSDEPSSMATLNVCAFGFKVDAIPEDGSNADLQSGSLEFELTDEISDNVRSMKLTDPEGDSEVLGLPTPDEPTVEVSAFLGDHPVDGTWRLEFDGRSACDVISKVTLHLAGEYEER